MKTIGIIIGIAVALIVGVSVWYATLGPGGAPGRIEAGNAKPADFLELCASAVAIKAGHEPSWSGARAVKSPPVTVQRSQQPQEITCQAVLRNGTPIAFQARIFCAAGKDCVNVM